MSILDNLNENQKQAVLQTDGPLLILAGAGSGKTRVITHRIAYLISEKKAPPTGIFAVTFTNKASEEMKKRVISLTGPAGKSVFVKTFHSAAVFILRRHGEKIGIPPSFSIYDTDDQASVIKEIMLKMRLDPKRIRPSSLASKISEIKDRAELVDGTDPSLLLPDYYSFDFLEVYKEYHRILAANNALDFNDLLIKTVDLFRSSPDVLERLQRIWNYFMIDEYQDTNYAQYLMAKYLASQSKNICVVGDDDQSIYSWRGADIRNILNFEHDYLNARVITLEENYRSTLPILSSASAVIRNNINRKEKNLRSFKGEGEPVTWCQANNEYGESEYVISTIMTLKSREGYKNRDFSIFYRTNAQSRLFEEQLRKENIPYRVVGGLRFYDRKEIKDILSYLKFIANPRDHVSLQRIINTPSRGIGKTSVEKILHIAGSEGITAWEVIEKDKLTERTPKGLANFKKIMKDFLASVHEIPRIRLSQFVSGVIENSGYKKHLEEEHTIESSSRLENIMEFLNSVYDYETTYPEATLDQFLQDISLLTSEEDPDEDPDTRGNSITLMTVHNAKGLEFPVVFITGMEEDIFPHKLSSDTEEGIEEERRLCYVGITRAQDRVFITSADLRRSYNEVFHREPSRFISEIPVEYMESTTYFSEGFSGAMAGIRRFPTRQKAEPGYLTETAEEPADGSGSGSNFSLRDSVMHPKYGVGRIIKIEGKGDNCKLTILFGASKKTFLEKYTPLERV